MNQEMKEQIFSLIDEYASLEKDDIRREWVNQMIDACLKMASEGHDSGQIKLVT